MKVLAVMGAWLPIFLFWLFFSMAYARISFAEALSRAVLNIGSAAILGTAVWRLSARAPWPREMKLSFYAGQLVAAAVYATLWTVSMYAFEALIGGMPFLNAVASSRVLGWQFLMGLWLYGVIAGICYAIQTQQRAESNERRALLAETALTEARLEALRSRLHPHFLFNALHTIAALVREDAAQAEEAVERLGDMLRYTLRDSGGDAVSFGEEWEFTRRYLEFERIRYGNRLRVAVAIDPACMEQVAPAFALQTLVENAVRHSIATRAEGGTIEITARVDGENLRVIVENDAGAGMPGVHDGSRYGLHGLRERLGAVFGDRAQLSVESRSERFRVTFSIPRIRFDDEESA